MNESNQLLRRIQSAELKILKEVTALCEKYGLKYYLWGGTLIGAVRHKGFIPWDDDIDIAMPRKDYDRFLRIAKEELPEHLFLQHYTTDKGYYLLFAKVRDNHSTFIEQGTKHIKMHKGIYIDIFPLDIISESKLIQKIEILTLRFLSRMYCVKKTYYGMDLSMFQKIILLLFRLIPINSDRIIRIYEKICRSCSNKDSNYIGSLMLGPEERDIYKKSWVERSVKFEFEGELFDGPACYDEGLRHYYGNYMQAPPAEKRSLPHYEFCDPENQYKLQ